MTSFVRYLALCFALILLSCSVALSQQITGSVTGTVTDPASAAISGAQVKLTNTGTGAVESAASDSEGNFRFLLLPPGTYSLRVTDPGFKKRCEKTLSWKSTAPWPFPSDCRWDRSTKR